MKRMRLLEIVKGARASSRNLSILVVRSHFAQLRRSREITYSSRHISPAFLPPRRRRSIERVNHTSDPMQLFNSLSHLEWQLRLRLVLLEHVHLRPSKPTRPLSLLSLANPFIFAFPTSELRLVKKDGLRERREQENAM